MRGDLERGAEMLTAKHSSLEGDPQQEGVGPRPVPLRGAIDSIPPNFTPSGSDDPLPSEFEVPLGSSRSWGRGGVSSTSPSKSTAANPDIRLCGNFPG